MKVKVTFWFDAGKDPVTKNLSLKEIEAGLRQGFPDVEGCRLLVEEDKS